MIRTLIAASALVLVAATAQAAAPHTTTIALAGLDLSDPADAARLDARIHTAAEAVCGPTEYPLGVTYTQFLAARERTAECVRLTERHARARLAALFPQSAAVRMAAAGH